MLLFQTASPRPANKPGLNPQTSETMHLKLTSSTGPETQGRIPLFLDVVPKARMHVYAPGQSGYIVITLTLDSDQGITMPAPAQFPKPEKTVFEPLNETQLVYSKPFRIVQDVALASGATATATIKGSLRYQACDDKVCYRPQTVPVTWTIAPKKV